MGTSLSAQCCCQSPSGEQAAAYGVGTSEITVVSKEAAPALFGDVLEAAQPKLGKVEMSPGSASTCEPPASESSPTPTTAGWPAMEPPRGEEKRAEPSAAEGTSGDRPGVPSAWQLALDEVREHCMHGRVLEASHALEKLEAQVGAARGDTSEATANFASELKSDAMLVEARAAGARMREMVGKIEPDFLPEAKKEKGWQQCTIKDPEIDDAFSAQVNLRWLAGAERDPHGPSAQLVTCGVLKNFPFSVEKFVSVYRETDLYQKDWMADCEKVSGRVSGPEKLYSALSQVVNASPLLPMKFELITIREFSVCSDGSPVGNFGPGVLVCDVGVPSDAATFAGWQLPPHMPRTMRMSNISMVLYFFPSPEKPGYCDAFVVAKFAASIPQWLLPLGMLKRLFANHYVSAFKAIKQNIVDGWDTLEYKRRIEECSAFYGTAAAVAKR